MNKIAAFVLTACFLLALSLQLPAPQPLNYEIYISVETVNGKRVIELGEKYAYAVPQGIQVKWTCNFDFLLQFEGETPFDESQGKEEISGIIRSFKNTIKADAKINHLYKYTIFVVDGENKNKPLTLDPVIIVKPPRG